MVKLEKNNNIGKSTYTVNLVQLCGGNNISVDPNRKEETKKTKSYLGKQLSESIVGKTRRLGGQNRFFF